MRVLILSRNPTLYTTRRLAEAAKRDGHGVEIVDPMECWLVCGRARPAVYHGPARRTIDGIDVVIPRIGPSATDYGLAVVQQFEIMGVAVANDAGAISRSRDKLRSLQLLSRHDVDIPKTVVARGPSQVQAALRIVGGPPVVLKLLQGSQGVGVMLAETAEALDAILHTIWSLGENLLVQEFVEECRGRDVRALVVGGRIAAAVIRTARGGEFRSNLHRGGVARALDLPPAHAAAAIQAARIMGLEIAGVDLLEARSGPKVVEVNASPGFEGVERATGIDVAAAVIRHAVALAAGRDASRPAERRSASSRA